MKKTLTKVALAAATCACAIGSQAETNTDGQWRGTGGAALSVTSGNTSSSSVLLSADASRATTEDKITLGSSVNYARAKTNGVDETTSSKWAALGQYDRNLTTDLFAFGKLGLEGDKLIDLSLRSSLAAGLGYKLINTEPTTFDIYAGLGYSTDKYSQAQIIDGKTDTTFSRASVYLGESSTHKLSSTVGFNQRLDVYPGISGDKAVIAKLSAGLAVALSGTMNLTVGLTDNYNSKPAAGVKSNDLGLFTGVNVKFGGP